MAIHERDREDLFRDARTMPIRAELLLEDETVVVGFRRQGQLSLYCGSDPVFQFNRSRQLRRAFFGGRRIAAKNGQLFELTRPTRGGNVRLVSVPVEAPMQARIVESAIAWLCKIDAALQDSATHLRVVGCQRQAFCDRIHRWLTDGTDRLTIADAPNA